MTVFLPPVSGQKVVTVAPKWTLREGTINPMRQERPEMSIPLLNAAERSPANMTRVLQGVRGRRIESRGWLRWAVTYLHRGSRSLQQRWHKSRKIGAFYEIDVLLPGEGREVDPDSIPCQTLDGQKPRLDFPTRLATWMPGLALATDDQTKSYLLHRM